MCKQHFNSITSVIYPKNKTREEILNNFTPFMEKGPRKQIFLTLKEIQLSSSKYNIHTFLEHAADMLHQLHKREI